MKRKGIKIHLKTQLVQFTVLVCAAACIFLISVLHSEKNTASKFKSESTNVAEILDEIRQYVAENPTSENDRYYITGYGLGSGEVLVWLNSTDAEAIAWFQNYVTDSDLVVFAEKTFDISTQDSH